MGSIGDNSSGGFYAYRVSKAALNMIAKNVSNELRSREVVVVAMHPGWVRTRMGGQSAPLSQCKRVRLDRAKPRSEPFVGEPGASCNVTV
jgi:NAD(P)-dependent dehydrogenase (short-subunit alcohol dehydrogenase family)